MNSIKSQKNVSVPSTTIIELREQNKSSQNKLDGGGNRVAGDYETKLNKTLYIEPNDQVEVASAFIDTASNTSGLIVLDPDTAGGNTTTISLEFGYYMTNTQVSAETGKDASTVEVCREFFGLTGAAANGTSVSEVDGERYVACKRVLHAGGVLSGSCEGIQVNFTSGIDPLKSNANSLYELSFKSNYVDTTTGQVHTQKQHIIFRTTSMELLKPFLLGGTLLNLDSVSMPKLLAVRDVNGTTLVAQSTLAFPFHFTGGAANIPQDDGSIWGDHNNPTGQPVPQNGFKDFFFQNKTVPAPDESRPLVTDTATIVVPSGHYSAEEITTQISILLTKATKDGAVGVETYDVVNNPLLTNMKQLLKKNQPSDIRFVRTDGAREFEFKSDIADAATRNYVVGTSQFGLNYDEGDMRVEITSQHSSLFNIDNADQAGQPEIRAYKTQANSLGNTTKFYADSYSGIFILNMKPNKLWTEQFKFRDLVVTPQMKNVAYTPLLYTVPTFEGDNALVVGKNITSDMTGVDASIQKVLKKTGAAITQSYDTPFEFPVAPAFQGILVNDTTPILASGSINDGSHGEETLGYYQLEIDFGVPSDIQGKDENTNKIQSIVSRYYQSGSFTSAYNEGSFAYIHPPTAAPMAVNSFKVRILQPDNTLANDISSNNSIFLKIIKNNNNI